jgi:Tfp pilus assembly protein PilO
MKSNVFSTALAKRKFATACTLIVIALGVTGYIRSSAVEEAEQKLEAKAKEGGRLQANIANGALLKDQLEELKKINEQISASAVTPSNLADNLQYFYKLEAATGTKIVDLRQTFLPGDQKGQKTQFVPVPYILALQGDYKSVMNFLRSIETGAQIARFTSVTLAPAAADSGKGAMLMNANIEILGAP